MKELLKKKCVPCEAGVEPFTEKQAKDYLAEHVRFSVWEPLD